MEKRFLYLILVIVIMLVGILAWQNSKQKSSSPSDQLNVTPTLALNVTPGLISQENKNPSMNQTQPAQNQSSPSATVELEGGLKYQDLVVGAGREVAVEDTIAVNYTGYLENGTKFDSSYDRNKPFLVQIGVGQVIKGWDLGIIGMKEGGKRRLFIPSSLAYGEQGAGESIAPNSNLIFDVELLSVK